MESLVRTQFADHTSRNMTKTPPPLKRTLRVEQPTIRGPWPGMILTPGGHLTVSGDISGHQNLGGGCSWHLAGTGQRCCWITHGPWDNNPPPQQRIIRSKKSVVLRLKNFTLNKTKPGSPVSLGKEATAWMQNEKNSKFHSWLGFKQPRVQWFKEI